MIPAVHRAILVDDRSLTTSRAILREERRRRFHHWKRHRRRQKDAIRHLHLCRRSCDPEGHHRADFAGRTVQQGRRNAVEKYTSTGQDARGITRIVDLHHTCPQRPETSAVNRHKLARRNR